MRGLLLAFWLVVALLPLGTGAAHAQPAPAAPPWEQWFAALNAGDVPGVVALMRTEVDEAGVLVPRCAGGCLGMDVIAASVAAMVGNGYQGTIIPASVQVGDGMVSFDVAEVVGVPPSDTVLIRWMMELDGDLIAPACAGICLRRHAAPAAMLTAQAPGMAAAGGLTALVVPHAVGPRPLPTGLVSPAAEGPSSGAAGATPAGWLLVGLVAGLLVLVASVGLDSWNHLRRRPPAAGAGQ